MLAEPPMGPRFAPIDTGRTRTQLALAHQACHPPTAYALTAPCQQPMQARTAIRPATSREDGDDRREEHPVLLPVSALRPTAPRIVPRARDPVAPTQPRHPERLPFAVDECEDVGFRVEQNRMAFFRRACSSCSRAWPAARPASASPRVRLVPSPRPAPTRGLAARRRAPLCAIATA